MVVAFCHYYLVLEFDVFLGSQGHRSEIDITNFDLQYSMEPIDPQVSFFTGRCEEHKCASRRAQLKWKIPIQSLYFDISCYSLQAYYILKQNSLSIRVIGTFSNLDKSHITLYPIESFVVRALLKEFTYRCLFVQPAAYRVFVVF